MEVWIHCFLTSPRISRARRSAEEKQYVCVGDAKT